MGKQQNIYLQGGDRSREEYEKLNGHKACVIWFTGLSGSGKSTIAGNLMKKFCTLGVRFKLLDGDNLRHNLCSDLGFTEADRNENIRRAAAAAELFFNHGEIAVCTFISPLRSHRSTARSLIPDGRFFEAAVKTSLAECRRRDPKGLYRRADEGKVAHMTGISAPYEESENAEIFLDTEQMTPEISAEAVIQKLRQQGIIF